MFCLIPGLEQATSALQEYKTLGECLTNPLQTGHTIPYRQIHTFNRGRVERILRDIPRHDLILHLLELLTLSRLDDLTVIEPAGITELRYWRTAASAVFGQTPFDHDLQEYLVVDPVSVGHVYRREPVLEFPDHLPDEFMSDLYPAFVRMHP